MVSGAIVSWPQNSPSHNGSHISKIITGSPRGGFKICPRIFFTFSTSKGGELISFSWSVGWTYLQQNKTMEEAMMCDFAGWATNLHDSLLAFPGVTGSGEASGHVVRMFKQLCGEAHMQKTP